MISLRFIMLIAFSIIAILTFFALDKYIGESYIFIWFTITSNVLLYFGFRRNAIFFDTFIGLFLWLGFWLKSTIRIIFLDSKFVEGIDNFIIPAKTFDEALFVSGMAFLSLIIASYLREKFLFKYPKKIKEEENGLFLFYKNNRNKILISYFFLFVFIGFTNSYFGIYQRGEIVETILPYGLNSLYKWLLLFGLASFSALILKYEFILEKKTIYLVPFLALLETCITNISLLSRGMILNSTSLGLGMIQQLKLSSIKTNKRFWFIMSALFVVLFLISVISVNNLRESKINAASNNPGVNTVSINDSVNNIKILFLDRWVGIEGIIAVSNKENKSWDLLKEAISEKYDENKMSFYDSNFISSAYKNTNMNVNHYVTLPGFIAFFYYSGQIWFLCIVLIILGLLASTIELFAYKFSSNNFIFAALIGQIIAYRYSHFGYVPGQSYLLFGSILLNVFIFFIFNKIFLWWYAKGKLNV